MNIFFTADTHFFHRNIIKYCNRPFHSVGEMNETMIANWNAVVKPRSIIYHLGDFGLGTEEEMAEIIAGQPDDSSYDEILRELAFARMVQRGLGDSDLDRTISNEQVKRKVESWQK